MLFKEGIGYFLILKLDGNGRFSKVMLSEVVRELMRREWVNYSFYLFNYLVNLFFRVRVENKR